MDGAKSVAWADYNNDGTLDLFMAGRSSSGNLLFQNNGNGRHWLKVRARGTASNSHAIGARVITRATIYGQSLRQMRDISAGSVIQHLEAHFGLGDAARIETLRIEWPSGAVQEFHDVASDQILTVWEPPALKAAIQPDGSCRLSLRAEPHRPWRLQASADLVSWDTVATVSSASVGFEHTEAAAGMSCRFYRLVSE